MTTPTDVDALREHVTGRMVEDVSYEYDPPTGDWIFVLKLSVGVVIKVTPDHQGGIDVHVSKPVEWVKLT
jgi:hypothetical protein